MEQRGGERLTGSTGRQEGVREHALAAVGPERVVSFLTAVIIIAYENKGSIRCVCATV